MLILDDELILKIKNFEKERVVFQDYEFSLRDTFFAFLINLVVFGVLTVGMLFLAFYFSIPFVSFLCSMGAFIFGFGTAIIIYMIIPAFKDWKALEVIIEVDIFLEEVQPSTEEELDQVENHWFCKFEEAGKLSVPKCVS